MTNNLSEIELFAIDLKASESMLKYEDNFLFRTVNFLGPSIIGVFDRLGANSITSKIVEGASYIYN